MAPIEFNGTPAEEITVNGQVVDEVTANGQLVYQAGPDIPDSEDYQVAIKSVEDISDGIVETELTKQADHIWYMDEGSGSTVGDSEGTEDGSISSASWVSGDGAGGVQLDFSDDNGVVEFGEIMQDETKLTFSAWCIHDGSTGQYLAHQAVTDGLVVWTDSDDTGSWMVTWDGTSESSEPATTNEWVLVTVTIDGSDVRLYENDANLVYDKSIDGSPSWNGQFDIGNRATDLDRPWNDKIDFPLLAPGSVASESEITDHYEETVDFYS